MEIKYLGIYTVIESFDNGDKIVAGSQVQVMEINEYAHPFVYCYGLNGGSAYIRKDNLKEYIKEA